MCAIVVMIEHKVCSRSHKILFTRSRKWAEVNTPALEFMGWGKWWKRWVANRGGRKRDGRPKGVGEMREKGGGEKCWSGDRRWTVWWQCRCAKVFIGNEKTGGG